jgi:hypothetical protein
MPRIIRSTTEALTIDTDNEDTYSAAAKAGQLLRRSFTEKDGEMLLDIELRSYIDPEGQHRFAVLYESNAEVHHQDLPGNDYTPARDLYEQMVRDEQANGDRDIDDDGNEEPFYSASDVSGADGYEAGDEESGDREGFMLAAESADAEAEEALRIAAQKVDARRVAFARASTCYGRGGKAVLARRLGKSEPTVKDAVDKGLALLAE